MWQTSRAARACSGGFTLVELLLVVIVIAILSAVSVPRLSGSYNHMELEEAARQVAALAEFGRERAILDETTYALSLDEDRREFRLSREEFDEYGIPRFRPVLSSECRVRLPERVSVLDVRSSYDGSGGGRLGCFWPGGQADELTVALANRKGERCEVVVHETIGVAVVAPTQ